MPAEADALVRGTLTTHPTLRQADLHLRLAENRRGTARAALLPTVNLQGGWEFNGPTLGAQQSSWVIGAEARINVFRGFADTSRMAEAGHARVRATAERERVARRIEVDVRSALAQLAAVRAGEDVGRAAVTQARESQRIIRDRYQSGLATVTDVLRAAEAVLDAELRATTAETNVVLQTVALDRALGRIQARCEASRDGIIMKRLLGIFAAESRSGWSVSPAAGTTTTRERSRNSRLRSRWLASFPSTRPSASKRAASWPRRNPHRYPVESWRRLPPSG